MHLVLIDLCYQLIVLLLLILQSSVLKWFLSGNYHTKVTHFQTEKPSILTLPSAIRPGLFPVLLGTSLVYQNETWW